MIKKAYGFTIVELLIGIVVIGILAAISTVAYSDVSAKANDAAVKSDLANLAKKISMDAAERGSYVLGAYDIPSSGGMNWVRFNIKFSVSKSAYNTNTNNLYYCTGARSGVQVFVIEAASRSGNVFRYDSSSGLQERGAVAGPTSDGTCSGLTSASFSNGYSIANGWFLWTS